MVFKPGQSGNPAGRARSDNPIVELARKAAPEAIKEIIRLAKESDDPKIRLQANEKIIERAYGKAAQAVELSGPEGGPIQLMPAITIGQK